MFLYADFNGYKLQAPILLSIYHNLVPSGPSEAERQPDK